MRILLTFLLVLGFIGTVHAQQGFFNGYQYGNLSATSSGSGSGITGTLTPGFNVYATGASTVTTDNSIADNGVGGLSLVSLTASGVSSSFGGAQLVVSSTNTFFGINAGNTGGTGANAANTAFGQGALKLLTSGIENTAVGLNACGAVLGNNDNVCIGRRAMDQLGSGNSNIAVGHLAGNTQTSGASNIAIGSNSVLPSTTGNQQLNIGNSIYGTNIYTMASSIGINTLSPSSSLHVSGTMTVTSGVSMTGLSTGTAASNLCLTVGGAVISTTSLSGCLGVSDPAVKKEIRLLPYGLKEVMAVDPILYKDIRPGMPDVDQVGLLAYGVYRDGKWYRGMEEVMPELVDPMATVYNGQRYKGIIYERGIAVAFKALQEQQQEIEDLRRAIQQLQHPSWKFW